MEQIRIRKDTISIVTGKNIEMNFGEVEVKLLSSQLS